MNYCQNFITVTSCEKRSITQWRRKETSLIEKPRKANWTGHVLRMRCLLKHITEGKIDGRWRRGRRLSGYWIILRKRGDTGAWKRKQWIAQLGELASEEAVDLSQNGLFSE